MGIYELSIKCLFADFSVYSLTIIGGLNFNVLHPLNYCRARVMCITVYIFNMGTMPLSAAGAILGFQC